MEFDSNDNINLARQFIAEKGGTLPTSQYSIRVPGLDTRLIILPEDEHAERYWVMLSEIYYATKWDSPQCLMTAIRELPDDQWDEMPFNASGERVAMLVVTKEGFYTLLLNNLKHFELRMQFLSAAWPHIFSLKKKDYAGVPDPLRTILRFWDIVDPGGVKRLITIDDLSETFDLPSEELEAIVAQKMVKVWDKTTESWIYRAETS